MGGLFRMVSFLATTMILTLAVKVTSFSFPSPSIVNPTQGYLCAAKSNAHDIKAEVEVLQKEIEDIQSYFDAKELHDRRAEFAAFAQEKAPTAESGLKSQPHLVVTPKALQTRLLARFGVAITASHALFMVRSWDQDFDGHLCEGEFDLLRLRSQAAGNIQQVFAKSSNSGFYLGENLRDQPSSLCASVDVDLYASSMPPTSLYPSTEMPSATETEPSDRSSSSSSKKQNGKIGDAGGDRSFPVRCLSLLPYTVPMVHSLGFVRPTLLPALFPALLQFDDAAGAEAVAGALDSLPLTLLLATATLALAHVAGEASHPRLVRFNALQAAFMELLFVWAPSALCGVPKGVAAAAAAAAAEGGAAVAEAEAAAAAVAVADPMAPFVGLDPYLHLNLVAPSAANAVAASPTGVLTGGECAFTILLGFVLHSCVTTLATGRIPNAVPLVSVLCEASLGESFNEDREQEEAEQGGK